MNKQDGDMEQGGNTILVVEDNHQAAKLLALYLAQAGYQALTAHDGSQALALAEQHSPMAITLDLLLPDMDGWEVLSKLKTMPLTRNIPVVIVSVLDRQALGFHLGAQDYLVKPVGRMELLHALKRCIPHEGGNDFCRKIMVVHSNADELNLLATMLEQENYLVIRALGAEEASSLARCALPDLVVTNLLAGGMDFFGLLEGLKAAPVTAHIPVLALTARTLGFTGQIREEDRIEFVLLQENELIEARLLAAITMLFRRQ